MYIHEAMVSRSRDYPCLTRKAWDYITEKPMAAAVKILPTDGPDGCVVLSASSKIPRYGWQPTAEDLVADDWKTVRL